MRFEVYFLEDLDILENLGETTMFFEGKLQDAPRGVSTGDCSSEGVTRRPTGCLYFQLVILTGSSEEMTSRPLA